mmetsp:Transcript_38464/g.70555  ORF Transcript_38464/g.70555 Transcript_38464/m.70555 type:complete len:810 (-) Transcript_38464:95-2524(-)
MNKLLHTPLHRMTRRAGGIRWSSYVGDVRCKDNNLSKNNFSTNNHFKNLHNINNNNNNIGLVSNIIGRNDNIHGRGNTTSFFAQTRSLSTTNNKKHTTATRKLSSNNRTAPHERLLVLGSGVAGCATALTAARHGIPVTVLHAGSDKEDCNSYWAQGGVIYRNYRLKQEEESGGGGSSESQLVDTPLSLVNDIRVASGYTSPLQRTSPLEECTYSSNLIQNKHSSSKMGQVCPTSGVHWNEDAAWKLACEGPSRIRELLLGSKDAGLGESHGCVVPFDRTMVATSGEDDDNDALNEKDGSEDDVLSLCLEASHSAPRIIHYADCTGKLITENITQAAFDHPLIEFVGDAVVTDLIMDESGSESSITGSSGSTDNNMVIGAQVLNKQTNQLSSYYAVHGVVLASGGLAGIYQHSTNPLGFNALGSSVGLALRLEDRLSSGGTSNKNGIVSDLEYVQFHPTSLYLPNEARFLVTEALRGEGAILRDLEGRAFASEYHPNAELAPRDIVARAVFCESQKQTASGEHNVYLDITHRDSKWLKDRFPSVNAHLQSRDTPMDFTKERIPVIPAAHYTCGGVTTDLNGCVVNNESAGCYRNLYAAGEAARTGLHGGNRLASTSLLEGLVFGASVGEMVAGVAGEGNDEIAMEGREKVMETMHQARHAIEHRLVMEQQQTASELNGAAADGRTSQEAIAILAHLKSLMWDNVGVVRTPSKLALAVSELSAIRDQADRLWDDSNGSAGWEVAALRDAAHSGLAVADAAFANRVSGGAHFVNLDEEEEADDGTTIKSSAAAKDQDSDSDDDDGLVAARA